MNAFLPMFFQKFTYLLAGLCCCIIADYIFNSLLMHYYLNHLILLNSKFIQFEMFIIITISTTFLAQFTQNFHFNFVSNTNSFTEIYSEIFGVLGVYAIIFTITQFSITKQSTKHKERYFGSIIDPRSYKMTVLDQWEKGFLFSVTLMYFILSPIFWLQGIFHLFLIALWQISFIVVAGTTTLNLIWGYQDLHNIDEDQPTGKTELLTISITNLYRYFLLSDVKYGTNKFIDGSSNRIKSISNKHERLTFLHSIYYHSITDLNYFLLVPDKPKNFNLNDYWYYFNRQVLGLYNRLLIDHGADKIRQIHQNFWTIIDNEHSSNDLQLAYIYGNSLNFLNILTKNLNIFNKVIQPSEIKKGNKQIIGTARRPYNLLFPFPVTENKSTSAKFWCAINQCFSNQISNLIKQLVGHNLTFHTIIKNPYIIIDKRSQYQKLETPLSEFIEYEVQKLLLHELSLVHKEPIKNKIEETSYDEFVWYLVTAIPEYSVYFFQYILFKNSDELRYLDLTNDELEILQKKTIRSLKIWSNF